MNFNQQNISNTAWAVSRIQYKNRPLFDASGAQGSRTIDDFGAQGISNTAWAVATMMGLNHGRVMKGTDMSAVACVNDFDSQALSNTAWAMEQQAHSNASSRQAICSSALALGPGLHL